MNSSWTLRFTLFTGCRQLFYDVRYFAIIILGMRSLRPRSQGRETARKWEREKGNRSFVRGGLRAEILSSNGIFFFFFGVSTCIISNREHSIEG